MTDFVSITPSFLQSQRMELERSIYEAQRMKLRYDCGHDLYKRLVDSEAYGIELQLFFDDYVVPYLATASFVELIKALGVFVTPSGLMVRKSDANTEPASDSQRTMFLNDASAKFSMHKNALVDFVLQSKFTFDNEVHKPQYYQPTKGYGVSTKIKALEPERSFINYRQDRLP